MGQLQHLTHPSPFLLRHLSASMFLVQNAPFSGLNISLEWFMSCSPNIAAGKGEKSDGLTNKALFCKVFILKSGVSGASGTLSL